MSFSDIINNIFGQDWLQAALNIIETSAAGIIIALWAKLRKKVVENNDNVSAFFKNITELKVKINDLRNDNNELCKSNEQLQEQNKKLMEGISALGEIISISFYSSKAISTDAKIKIVEATSSLKKLGFDVQKAAEAIASIDETPEVTVEQVEQIKEEQQVVAVESLEKAEDTESKSYDIYNQILNEQ